MRAIDALLRRALEEPRSDEYIVVMLRITHDSLAEPILVANDVVDYVVGGELYLGFPFKMEILGDTNQAPRGRIEIQNVDRRIGDAVVALTTPPRLSILLFASSDFGELSAVTQMIVVDPEFILDLEEDEVDQPLARVELELDTTPEYEAHHLIFGSISVDAMQVSGEIQSFDMSNEPWPAIRSTGDRLPGLEP